MQSYALGELQTLVEALRNLYDLVRVVDPANAREVDVLRSDENGLCYGDDRCYAVWHTKSRSCLNCVSLRAVREDERQCKFEFIGEDAYYVVASPIQLLGTPLALELVCRVGEEAMLHGCAGSELMARVADYNEQFRIDEVTGLHNRHYLGFRLRSMLDKAKREQGDVTLALVDIDCFGEINERYGRDIGDRVLRTVGQVLSGSVSQRRGDLAVRFGGDEFVLAFYHMPDALLRERLQNLREHVAALRVDGLAERRITLSIGCCRSGEQGAQTTEELIAQADKRLYMAKEQGRDRAIFEDER